MSMNGSLEELIDLVFLTEPVWYSYQTESVLINQQSPVQVGCPLIWEARISTAYGRFPNGLEVVSGCQHSNVFMLSGAN